MVTTTKELTRLDQVDKGKWLSRLLDEIQTNAVYQPSALAVLRMRTRIFESMAEPEELAA